ncbi:hypothetical protein GCM10019016_080420 [Streptomyces prasinosporus]|jgi:hypothetical protein|uniref:Uncharacterized protein n=2 Tax=Streptomyces TaxID=1883 RepID=A0ABP6U006_9ACTN|nr:hypothetical protein [Streptomyces tricolor]MCG0062131.1 hypothetical protein [Streptomyces tricolor]GHC14347.1 hypothetical protein GCM10010332_50630 [Streptomyces albogriseolus]
MPQGSVGRAASRKPALVLLVGLVLTLTAHLVACAVHAAEDHGPAVSAASPTHGKHGAHTHGTLAAGPACSPVGWADEHPGQDADLCCDPADLPADLRAASGSMLLAFPFLALLSLGRRPEDPTASGAPPGPGEGSRAPGSSGLTLLQLVCVSRT